MDYKEFDFEGEETLKAMSHANLLNEWMYSQIKPYTEGKILEIGSGIGNISQFFINDNIDIELSDIRQRYLESLKIKFPNNNIHNLNLVHSNFDMEYSHLLDRFSLVFALNVIEHIEDDHLALLNISKLLKPQGVIYILVPAHSFLYNNFDRALLHYRRYNELSLAKIFPDNTVKVKSWYFNFAGIFGWFIVGSLLKRRILPENSIKLYNFLTPIFKFFDTITLGKLGLSVIQVSKKTAL